MYNLRTDLGLEKRVHFLSKQDNVANVLSDADVFCMTSDFEGLPLALLEAMAFSLPCIVTDAGGMGKAVLHGFNGIVCPKGEKKCIAEAMGKLFHDNRLLSSMGTKSLERAHVHYNQDQMVQLIEKVYIAQ